MLLNYYNQGPCEAKCPPPLIIKTCVLQEYYYKKNNTPINFMNIPHIKHNKMFFRSFLTILF